jgi:hypothetical protein
MFIHRIQLLERFYDPTAGEIYVRLFRQHPEVLLLLKPLSSSSMVNGSMS